MQADQNPISALRASNPFANRMMEITQQSEGNEEDQGKPEALRIRASSSDCIEGRVCKNPRKIILHMPYVTKDHLNRFQSGNNTILHITYSIYVHASYFTFLVCLKKLWFCKNY